MRPASTYRAARRNAVREARAKVLAAKRAARKQHPEREKAA